MAAFSAHEFTYSEVAIVVLFGVMLPRTLVVVRVITIAHVVLSSVVRVISSSETEKPVVAQEHQVVSQSRASTIIS